MATKKQKIADILNAITQIKIYISQDSKNNPMLSEALYAMLNDFLNKLYEAESRQLKNHKKI